MPTITVTRGPCGELQGHTIEDQRQLMRLQRRQEEMQPGDTLVLSWQAPRSPEFHRMHFAMLNWVFDNQEAFAVRRAFRKWGEMGAGHCGWVAGPNGVMVPVPKSIDYVSLDDDEFRELHMDVRAFLQSPAGLHTLWPHVEAGTAWAALENMMKGSRQ